MAKMIVRIEEHLVREIELESPINMEIEERIKYAKKKIIENYKKSRIILNADDYNGITLIEVEDTKTGIISPWKEI